MMFAAVHRAEVRIGSRLAKVRWKVPELCRFEPGAPSVNVTVCSTSPMAQVQVTVPPAATLMFAGEKKLLPTVTAPVAPPVVGPVVLSDPPPPHPTRATIASVRINEDLRMTNLPSGVTFGLVQAFMINSRTGVARAHAREDRSRPPPAPHLCHRVFAGKPRFALVFRRSLRGR
jgi:hypothetical protein